MKMMTRRKDGGPASPVDAYFLFEFKRLGSIALLRFNKGGRKEFHTHAFNALTWFICGSLVEQVWRVGETPYRRSLFPKYTPRSCNHRVVAHKTSWCLTVRGPWAETWTEDSDTSRKVFTWGRKVLSDTSRT